MPVMNSCGELAVYATVDLSKKTKHKVPTAGEEESKTKEDLTEENKENEEECNNYANVAPTESKNYVNLEFAQSLELYENSRDVVRRACLEGPKYCNKCGHPCQQQPTSSQPPQDDYLLMGPAASEVRHLFYYIHRIFVIH
jgi:rubrerythrin